MARCKKVLAQFAFGTAKNISVIDKKRIQVPRPIVQEYRLPVVGMSGANVNQPGKPEALVVSDPTKTGSRQNLKETCAITAKEAGTEAQT
jgi:hypothetical protein